MLPLTSAKCRDAFTQQMPESLERTWKEFRTLRQSICACGNIMTTPVSFFLSSGCFHCVSRKAQADTSSIFKSFYETQF